MKLGNVKVAVVFFGDSDSSEPVATSELLRTCCMLSLPSTKLLSITILRNQAVCVNDVQPDHLKLPKSKSMLSYSMQQL